MASEHAGRACSLCRQRRVRCDKTLPTCRRCSKFGQPCPGYPIRQRFIDQSDTVRNKLNDQSSPSSSASRQHHSTSLDSSPRTGPEPGLRRNQHRKKLSPRSVNDGSNPTRPYPIPLTGGNAPFTPPTTSRPVNQPATVPDSLPMSPPVEDFAMDISMQQLLEDSGSEYFDLDIDSYYANGTNACGFFPGIPVALPSEDGLGVLDGIHDSQMSGSVRAIPNASPGINSCEVNLNKEVALLINLFVDFLAPWMDLFDFDAYFTRILPVEATPNILLQSAVAAVAAKQMARHVLNGCAKSASRYYAYIMADYQGISSNEWFYKAACYYDRGISHLRVQLQQSSMFSNENLSPNQNTLNTRTHADDPMQLSVNSKSCQIGNRGANTQCLFSAISIFSLYETLDDCLATSSQHLPGFLALFENGGAPKMPQSLTAGRAAFWYFARKEALAAYAHHTKPRIDPDCVSTWTSAGVPIQVLHLFSSQSPITDESVSPHPAMFEDRDAAHRILIWILTKAIDLVTSDDSRLDATTPSSQNLFVPQSSVSIHHAKPTAHTFSSVWTGLRQLLAQWYDSRSKLLIPHATIMTKNPQHVFGKPRRTAFFTNPTGVAVLQLYHFIQIILLINQPTRSMDQGSRLRMLKENSTEVEHHSREICAIAFGRQVLAIQRHMSHPLQLAGAYFEAKEDRDAVYELLREIALETSSPIEIPG